jgi:hypothetical protein
MSNIVPASHDLPPHRSEVRRAVPTKAAANPHGQPKGFGAVLEKAQAEETEPRRPCSQGKLKAKNQSAGDLGQSVCPDAGDSTNLLPPFPPWMRAEGAVRPDPAQITNVGQRTVVATCPDRVLVGTGGSTPEARVRIGDGPLAGTEIQLVAVPGGVEARVLTVHAGSRQTLSVAMDEIAQRLRRKGHALRMSTSEGRGHGRDRDDSRGHPSDE